MVQLRSPFQPLHNKPGTLYAIRYTVYTISALGGWVEVGERKEGARAAYYVRPLSRMHNGASK